MAKNRVIGTANKIPWHVPEDFKFFKKTTMGGILLMGRKTFESIGKPLPGRISAILSKSFPSENLPENVVVLRDFSDVPALKSAFPSKQIFLCGGAEIYRQFLPNCSTLFLTEIDAEPSGDAAFPRFENLFENEEIIQRGENFVIKKFTKKLRL